MSRTFCYAAAAFLTLASLGGMARAAWPAQVFAPYFYIPNEASDAWTNVYNATGQKYFTLAFMNTKNSKETDPYWEKMGDNGPIYNHLYHQQIDAIRAKGGDVIVSFGGADANSKLAANGSDFTELAAVEPYPGILQAKYQAVIDEYKLTWIDQDIEEANVHIAATNERRNTALAGLQKANPGLIIGFTLPVDPNGLSQDSLHLLTDAHQKGIKPVVNIMTMYFGGQFDRMGKTMGELAIMAAEATHAQLASIDPDIKIGITPQIGSNGGSGEVFTTRDAQTVLDYAKAHPWIREIAFWEVQQDSGARRGRAATGGAATRAGGPATRRGGRNGRRGATTGPALATAGIGVPPAGQWGYIDVFRNFTTGFTPAQ